MVGLLLLCIICQPKPIDYSDTVNEIIDNSDVLGQKSLYPHLSQPHLSKCQIDYGLCKENLKVGSLNKPSNYCHTCKENGEFPDKIYHSKVGWINLDPQSGESIDDK
jgi:hypothetical protein